MVLEVKVVAVYVVVVVVIVIVNVVRFDDGVVGVVVITGVVSVFGRVFKTLNQRLFYGIYGV